MVGVVAGRICGANSHGQDHIEQTQPRPPQIASKIVGSDGVIRLEECFLMDKGEQ